MSRPGLGAMIHYLSGGSKESPEKYIGKKIVAAELDSVKNELRLTFSDGINIKIHDDGQSCCETRYMTTDDDLSKIIGGVLKNILSKEGPELITDGDKHEQVFIEVQTDIGFITIANHNEHNGYYGGFGLSIEEKGPF